MWFANFLVASSTTMVMPFLSLYISTMGNYSEDFISRWAGFTFSITFVTAFILSPVWGRFGDKHGYKKILLFTGTGISLSLFLMGFVTSVTQLFLLRLLMGCVTGFIPLSVAFISSQTPKKIAGQTLGTLQTGAVTGQLFGPLFGGMLADTVGFRFTFVYTACAILVAVLLVLFGVKEKKKERVVEKVKQYSKKEVLQFMVGKKTLFAIMIVTLLVQIANLTIQPLLALYVDQLTNTEKVASYAGLAFSAIGFGNLIATRQWGKLGDRIGHIKVILGLLVVSAIIFIPQALVTALWQLIVLRFLFGMASGGIIPCMTAYIRQVAPYEIQGELQGYNTSFRFLGNVIGPSVGGIVAGYIGISSVFYVTSAIVFLAFGILFYQSRKEKRKIRTTDPHTVN